MLNLYQMKFTCCCTYAIMSITISNLAMAQEVFNTVRMKKELPYVKLENREKVLVHADTTKGVKVDSLSLLRAQVELPLKNLKVNSPFGKRKDPFTGKWRMHKGIDFDSDKDSVRAVMGGIVKNSGFDKNLGLYVKINHGIYSTIYAHLSSSFVENGQRLKPGSIIGITGNSGRSTGDHLHFAVKRKRKFINPTGMIGTIQSLIQAYNTRETTSTIN